MTAPEPAQGWLVITAINTVNGGAGSSTFAVTGTSRGEGVERIHVTDTEDGGEFVITTHEPDAILPEVEPYRDLVRALIAADTPCPGFACSITTLGHLLLECSPEQQDMVRALDPSQQETT